MNNLSLLKRKIGIESGFLVTNPIHIYYLTGLKTASPHEIESILLITPNDSYLIVPSLYAEQAKKVVSKGFFQLIVDTERKGLLTTGMNLLPKKSTILIEEEHLHTSVYFILKEKYKANPLPSKQIIESLREVKQKNEIKMMKKAILLTDKTLKEVIQWLRSVNYTKITELEVAEKIRAISTHLGGEGMGFDPIVASGNHSSEPHYIPQTTKLTKNTPLLIDMGVSYKGYTGDLTRTYFMGTPTKEFLHYYKLVQTCQKQIIKTYKEGASTGEIQQKAVLFFAQNKLEKLFTHSIGHGIGLQIHERPHFSPKLNSKLHNNMVVTVEPGLYLEGKFGIRIEDVVQIQGDRPIVLSSSRYRDLQIMK